LESRLVLDLEEHPFLADHAFIRVPESFKPVQERLPTLPMTGGLEVLAEAAAYLVPDLPVASCHDIEASRWIALESARTLPLTVRARRVAQTEVEVKLYTDGKDRPALIGQVTLAGALPPAPPPLEVHCDRPCPHTGPELYTKPFLFHGPRFHVVTALHGMSDTAITAGLTLRDPQELFARPLEAAPLFDLVLVDGIGQVLGYKVLLEDWVTYPLRVGRLTRHGPTPPAGTTVRAAIRYRKLDGRRVEFDADVLYPDGIVWLRLERYQLWRLLWPKELSAFSRRPHEGRVGVPWPTAHRRACCCRIALRLFGEISPDWVARYCLTMREWAGYVERPRLDWLLGRIALKDAVRDWYRQKYGRALFHLEVEIDNLASGAPVLVSPAEPLAISVAHLDDEAVALVAEARGAGVDLLRVEGRGPEVFDAAFEADERAVLAAAPGDALAWLHRGWCAREAVAKAHGLGRGALDRFRVRAIREDGTVEVEYVPDGKRSAAQTHLDGDRVIAVAVLT
jgi:phosphopantetheinyl transferase (holo-ACP synthase)